MRKQTMGERMRARRKELELSADDVANDAGVGVSTYYELENGRQKSSTRLAHIAVALRTTVRHLESGEEPKDVTDTDTSGYQLTAAAAELAREWERLSEHEREVMARAIHKLFVDRS